MANSYNQYWLPQDAQQVVDAKAPAAAPAAPSLPQYDPYASPIYTGAQNIANQQYGNTLAGLHNQENLSASNLGATLTRDPSDNITGGSVDWNTIDTTNPFAQAALLKRSYLQNRGSTINNMADRGHLGSGALQGVLANGQFNYEQGQDSIAKQLQQMVLNSTQSKNEAAAGKDNSMYQAYLAALQAAPQP